MPNARLKCSEYIKGREWRVREQNAVLWCRSYERLWVYATLPRCTIMTVGMEILWYSIIAIHKDITFSFTIS